MSVKEIEQGFLFPEKFWTDEWKFLFPSNLLSLIVKLHQSFEPRRQQLLHDRKLRQASWNRGEIPYYLDSKSIAASGDWKVSPIPPDLLCRRVEITGPVNSAKMVINMLSRNSDGARADMAMLDFEDSMKPSFLNILTGYKNVIDAITGNLSYKVDAENGEPIKEYKLNPQDSAYVMVRVRGLHLCESNIRIDGEFVSAGLLDLVMCFYHTSKIYRDQGKNPKYYIPKCEHYLEARWWNELFIALENYFQFPIGTIKTTFLIETLPATFQIEEILYEIREHVVGLNVGRWDKIFSDIKVFRFHRDKIMADRASVNMSRPWMENYAKRVIKICHERGALAIGGMSAFTPGKSQQQREEQIRKVQEDKRIEASWGHDGCWVSHPFFIGIAMKAFKFENQLQMKLNEFDKYPDILPRGTGPHTLVGLRTNIRVGIAYLNGWLQDVGCVALDNLMEDLATLEISRAQTWQWLHHQIELDDGNRVSKELIEVLFEEEFQKIIHEFEPSSKLSKAKDQAQKLFLEKDLSEFLTFSSERI